MPTLHQYDYLFAFGVIFCTLDAYQIGRPFLRQGGNMLTFSSLLPGANDVANSWATSVSSKSVTMKQAIVGAAICEFLVSGDMDHQPLGSLRLVVEGRCSGRWPSLFHYQERYRSRQYLSKRRRTPVVGLCECDLHLFM